MTTAREWSGRIIVAACKLYEPTPYPPQTCRGSRAALIPTHQIGIRLIAVPGFVKRLNQRLPA